MILMLILNQCLHDFDDFNGKKIKKLRYSCHFNNISQNDLHFVRYNTAVTSSAAVERLFSCAGLIATSQRTRLSDSTFEKLLMLKANHDEPQ